MAYVLFSLCTHLLVHLVNVLKVIVARLLQPLEGLVEEELKVLERILGECVTPQPCARFAAQQHARFVIVVNGALHQHRLVQLVRAYLQ